MAEESVRLGKPARSSPSFGQKVKQAFRKFLIIPTLIFLGLIAVAFVMIALDHTPPGWLQPLRTYLESQIFRQASSTAEYLSTLAGGIITLTSVIVSMLLITLQQSAATMGNQIYDQFFRQRRNQVYLGTFIGSAIYALIVQAFSTDTFNPVLGAALGLLLAALDLYFLILLLYTTINQMRPEVVLGAIHDQVIKARRDQRDFLARTRREPHYRGRVERAVRTDDQGYLVGFDLREITAAEAAVAEEFEVDLQVFFGSYVSYQDTIALVRAETEESAVIVEEAVQRAYDLAQQRKYDLDPVYGIEQIEEIGWTAISTAKQIKTTSLIAIHMLRDLLARFATSEDPETDERPVPVVYHERLVERILETFESFTVASSESLQFQAFTEVVTSLATLYERLPREYQTRTEDLILRALSVMGDHALTYEMEVQLKRLINALEENGGAATAEKVTQAMNRLAKSVGQLNSRSTRAQQQKKGG